MKSIIAFLEVVFVIAVAAATSQAVPMEKAVIDRFIKMYDIDTTNHEVKIMSCGLKTSTVLPQHIQIRPTTQKEPLGIFSAIVRIVEDGKEIESAPVRFEIKLYADVLVANENLQRSDQDLAARCVLRRMDITDLNERPLEKVAELNHKRAKRNLRRGTILTAGSIEPIPDVESGHEVSITYVNGPIQITAAGTALQSGMAGDYIKVKNMQSGKIIMARVVDNAQVAIDP
jgi:flagella basal body P-ring formation protein FlgA